MMKEPFAFSVVAKPTGAACNLDCKYCFFLSKELLYDARRQNMSDETLQTYVRTFLEESPDGDVTMLWQGGEPLMRGLPFYERAIELSKKYSRRTQRVHHALQTNGTLITEQWARFFRDNDVLVGVSIDGPEEYHDAYRVNKAGRGTHALVIRGWKLLEKFDVQRNILCTVHHANQDHGAEIYRYFRDDLHASYIQFIPIVERVQAADIEAAEQGWTAAMKAGVMYQQDGQFVTSRTVDPHAYGQFLIDVFHEWSRHDIGTVSVQDFDAAVNSFFGVPSVCVHAPECGNNFAMEFNGDVYACDHWVEPDWLLGNVNDSSFQRLSATQKMREFSTKKQNQLTKECRDCPFLTLCWGGCPKDRFVSSSSGQRGHNYLCAGYKSFYAETYSSFMQIAGLLSSGHRAAEFMDVVRLHGFNEKDRADVGK
ncbi:MAG: anaerobic sulfatase maturase [Actinomycetaceae bacterium]|nr:anaerobic sulfatase maturase [Actinomycetaceae bacterium]